MFKLDKTLQPESENWEYDFEFWPKQAEELLNRGELSHVIELCEKNLPADPGILSARIIYSRALCGLNRLDEAVEQLYQILSIDPDNMAALKLLGDTQYRNNDTVSAMASYGRVLEIDPDCRGLKCAFAPKELETPQKLVLQRSPETPVTAKTDLVERLFRTETVGDIYLKQGQLQEALEIFRELASETQNDRLNEKLANAKRLAALKEKRDVEQ